MINRNQPISMYQIVTEGEHYQTVWSHIIDGEDGHYQQYYTAKAILQPGTSSRCVIVERVFTSTSERAACPELEAQAIAWCRAIDAILADATIKQDESAISCQKRIVEEIIHLFQELEL